MYEDAQIIDVGKADEVILGISMFGVDLDTRDFPEPFQFYEDPPSLGVGD